MNITYRDYDKPGVALSYDSDENVFSILDSEQEIISQCDPVLDLDNEYDPNNFEIYKMKNNRSNCTENSIYQVYVEDQRIGWIFPLQSLLSTEHEYSDNKHYLKYAYVAYYKLIDMIEEKECDSTSTFTLSDYYSDDTIVLVIDKDNTSKLEKFEIDDYTVGLFKWGYAFEGEGNLISEMIDLEGKSKIKIKPISKSIVDREYILNIFRDDLTRAKESFAIFHILYQIVEILIFKVFENEFKSFISTIDEDATALFDKKEDLGKITNEKYRINRLFDNNYTTIESDNLKYLKERCNRLLDMNGKETKESPSESLYQVRNMIVHSMYILSKESHEVLEKINKVFVDVIIDMITTFTLPDE